MIPSDSRTVVSDDDANTAQPTVLSIARRVSVNPYSAAFAYCFHRIHHQIGKDLPQLAGIAHHYCVRIVFFFQADPGLVAAMLIKLEDTVENRGELHRNRPFGFTIKTKGLLHDVADPLEFFL